MFCLKEERQAERDITKGVFRILIYCSIKQLQKFRKLIPYKPVDFTPPNLPKTAQVTKGMPLYL